MEGFYRIPLYSNYMIDRQGIVFSYLSMGFLEGSINPAGYLHYRIKGDDGYVKTMGAHRLVAMTYLGLPDGYENLDVNHLNGIKSDNRVENLEWATRLENIYHAGYTSLTEKCIPIQVRNVLTGLVNEFPSYIACAEAFGLTKDAISWRVNAGEQYVDELNHQYRKLTNRLEWAIPTQWNNGVLLRDAITGVVTHYSSQQALANAFNVSASFISKICTESNQPLFRLGDSLYQVMSYTPNPVWLIRQNPYLEYENTTRCRFIVMYNPSTENQRIFFTLSEAAEAYGVKKNVPYNRAKANRLDPWHDGLICHYLFNR